MSPEENAFYWTSYRPVLKDICETLKPLSIVEYGAGESTELLAEWCPDALILSIEHQEKYYNQVTEAVLDLDRVRVMLRRLSGVSNGAGEGYVMAPLEWMQDEGLDHVDLVFIDGRRRADCVAFASMISPVAILHDTHRPNYFNYQSLWRHPFVVPSLRTAVLQKQPQFSAGQWKGLGYREGEQDEIDSDHSGV